jgi:hypothetical protein
MWVDTGVSFGTLGVGPEVNVRSPDGLFGLRLGAHFFDIGRHLSIDGIEFKTNARLQSGGATVDYYPFHNGFRLSAGVLYDGSYAKVSADPAASTITYDGITYQNGAVTVNGQPYTGGPVTVNGQTYTPSASTVATVNSIIGSAIAGSVVVNGTTYSTTAANIASLASAIGTLNTGSVTVNGVTFSTSASALAALASSTGTSTIGPATVKGVTYNPTTFNVSGVTISPGPATINGVVYTVPTVTVGSHTYTAESVGVINGTAHYNPVVPYAGLGYTYALFGKVPISFDIGAIYQGPGSLSLSASGPITSDPVFMNDLAQESATVRKYMRFGMFYPVAEISISYRF